MKVKLVFEKWGTFGQPWYTAMGSGRESTDGLGGAAAAGLTLNLDGQRPLIEHGPHAKPCSAPDKAPVRHTCHTSKKDKCHTTQRQVFWIIITTEKLTP